MQLKRALAGVGVGGIMLAVAIGVMAAEKKSETPTVKRERVVSLTATVEGIDVAKRLVTLKGPKGNVVTIQVDERVKNLPQVHVGDHVVVKYYEALALRVLPPGEAAPAASATGAAATAQPGQKPAAVGAREVNVTVTIEAIDLKAHTVTFKGPEGNVVTVKAQDPKNLQKVMVGDKVEITYTEALAVSVQKAKTKS